ncbi:MAG: histidinol-phosphatase [Clostridia bacterium]|nr:histidinol-phosphatase [Clostridia bacterium]
MKPIQNLHTHSTYCDGKDAPEQMILAAIEKGFKSIGFSGHSYTYFDAVSSMSPEGTEQYKKEIRSLAEKYKDKIKVFLGIEYDYFSELDTSDYDYVIGSVHCLKFGENYYGVDSSKETTSKIIAEYFGGDGLAFAKEYYRLLADLPNRVNADIIGHIDLITKFHGRIAFFDEDSKEYLNVVAECLEKLKGKIEFFEVNTGAIGRGYRSTPYPNPAVVKLLKEYGFKAVINSDCHNKDKLDVGYDLAIKLLAENGFDEYYILTENGFSSVKITNKMYGKKFTDLFKIKKKKKKRR